MTFQYDSPPSKFIFKRVGMSQASNQLNGQPHLGQSRTYPMHPVTSPSPADTCVRSCIALSDVFARLVAMEHHSHHSRLLIPVCGAYGGLYPNLSRINFLGPSFFRINVHSQKRAQPQAYMVQKKNPESILGPWGQTFLDKVPVAKVLFIFQL